MSSIKRRVSLVAGCGQGGISGVGGGRELFTFSRTEAFSFRELYKPSGSRYRGQEREISGKNSSPSKVTV